MNISSSHLFLHLTSLHIIFHVILFSLFSYSTYSYSRTVSIQMDLLLKAYNWNIYFQSRPILNSLFVTNPIITCFKYPKYPNKCLISWSKVKIHFPTYLCQLVEQYISKNQVNHLKYWKSQLKRRKMKISKLSLFYLLFKLCLAPASF